MQSYRTELVSEERSEDPLVVLINSVVGKHGATRVTTRDTNEWTTRIID